MHGVRHGWRRVLCDVTKVRERIRMLRRDMLAVRWARQYVLPVGTGVSAVVSLRRRDLLYLSSRGAIERQQTQRALRTLADMEFGGTLRSLAERNTPSVPRA